MGPPEGPPPLWDGHAAERLAARGRRPPRRVIHAVCGLIAAVRGWVSAWRRRSSPDAARSARKQRGSGAEVGDDLVREAVRGPPVPERRRPLRRPRALGDQRRQLGDSRRIEAEQGVGPLLDRDRPLGVVAQREAGDAEVGRLLLDAAGVGQDRAGLRLQREEVEIADRVDQMQRRQVDRRRRRRAPRGSADGTGKRTGIDRETAASASIAERSSGPSTSAGRCSVTSRYEPGSRP